MDISPARQLNLNNSLSSNQVNNYLRDLEKRVTALEEKANGSKAKDAVRRTKPSKGSGSNVSSS